jgi:endoglycosylceramidase
VLVDVLVRPYPERVAGDPISYAFDAASATFTLVYAPDRGLAPPTEIAVPARRYPNGYQVECGGCAYAPRDGQLLITVPPPGDDATVIIHP